MSSPRTPPPECNNPEQGHRADDFYTIPVVLHCWCMFISPVLATISVLVWNWGCNTVLGSGANCSSWAAVPSVSGHQELLENIHCTQSDAGYFYLHTQDIFHLPLSNLPIPSCGYLGEGGGCFSSSKSLVVDPENLEDGSLLCSLWLNCQKAGTSPILSASSPFPVVAPLCSMFLAQKCHVAVPENSCPYILLPTPALRGPNFLQSHPLWVVIVVQGKGRELKHS